MNTDKAKVKVIAIPEGFYCEDCYFFECKEDRGIGWEECNLFLEEVGYTSISDYRKALKCQECINKTEVKIEY